MMYLLYVCYVPYKIKLEHSCDIPLKCKPCPKLKLIFNLKCVLRISAIQYVQYIILFLATIANFLTYIFRKSCSRYGNKNFYQLEIPEKSLIINSFLKTE